MAVRAVVIMRYTYPKKGGCQKGCSNAYPKNGVLSDRLIGVGLRGCALEIKKKGNFRRVFRAWFKRVCFGAPKRVSFPTRLSGWLKRVCFGAPIQSILFHST